MWQVLLRNESAVAFFRNNMNRFGTSSYEVKQWWGISCFEFSKKNTLKTILSHFSQETTAVAYVNKSEAAAVHVQHKFAVFLMTYTRCVFFKAHEKQFFFSIEHSHCYPSLQKHTAAVAGLLRDTRKNRKKAHYGTLHRSLSVMFVS